MSQDLATGLFCSSSKAMSPPALHKQPIRILTAVFNAPIWRKLLNSLRSVFLLILKPFSPILHRPWAILKCQRPKQSPTQCRMGYSTLYGSLTWPQVGLTYTVMRTGNTIPLNDISTSVYPFAGGSIRRTSWAADRPTHPNGRLTPYNRSVASLMDDSNPVSRSATNSIYNLPLSGLTNQEAQQIEGFEYGPNSRPPLRRDDGLPDAFVETESPIAEHFTPAGPVIEEVIQSPRNPSPIIDKTSFNMPSGSAASSHTRNSSRRNSVTFSEQSSWDDGWDLSPAFPRESFRYELKTKMLVSITWQWTSGIDPVFSVKEDTDIQLGPLDFSFETLVLFMVS